MYGLPKDFDISVFVGMELIQICFAVNQMSAHFEKKITITSESSFGYSIDKNGAGAKVYRIPVQSTEIMELIGHNVAEATVVGSGGLCLLFDNGHSLIFYDDMSNYESYHIYLSDKEIHV